jgi:hypothetical protein
MDKLNTQFLDNKSTVKVKNDITKLKDYLNLLKIYVNTPNTPYNDCKIHMKIYTIIYKLAAFGNNVQHHLYDLYCFDHTEYLNLIYKTEKNKEKLMKKYKLYSNVVQIWFRYLDMWYVPYFGKNNLAYKSENILDVFIDQMFSTS